MSCFQEISSPLSQRREGSRDVFPFLLFSPLLRDLQGGIREEDSRGRGGEVFYGLFKASAAAEPRRVRKGMRVLDRERWTSSLLCLLEEQEKNN